MEVVVVAVEVAVPRVAAAGEVVVVMEAATVAEVAVKPAGVAEVEAVAMVEVAVKGSPHRKFACNSLASMQQYQCYRKVRERCCPGSCTHLRWGSQGTGTSR